LKKDFVGGTFLRDSSVSLFYIATPLAAHRDLQANFCILKLRLHITCFPWEGEGREPLTVLRIIKKPSGFCHCSRACFYLRISIVRHCEEPAHSERRSNPISIWNWKYARGQLCMRFAYKRPETLRPKCFLVRFSVFARKYRIF
jgi:hypothetical protein